MTHLKPRIDSRVFLYKISKNKRFRIFSKISEQEKYSNSHKKYFVTSIKQYKLNIKIHYYQTTTIIPKFFFVQKKNNQLRTESYSHFITKTIKFHTTQIISNTQTNRSRKTTTKREQPHRRHCLPLLHVYTYRLAHLRPLYLSGAPEAAARLRKPATTVIAHHHSAAHDGGARRGAPPRGQARRRAPLFRRC